MFFIQKQHQAFVSHAQSSVNNMQQQIKEMEKQVQQVEQGTRDLGSKATNELSKDPPPPGLDALQATSNNLQQERSKKRSSR